MNQKWWKIPGKNGEVKLTTQDLFEFIELYAIRLPKQNPNIVYNRVYHQVLSHLKLDKEHFYPYSHVEKLHRDAIQLSKDTATWIIE